MQTLHKGLFGSTDGGFDSTDWAVNDPWAGLPPIDPGNRPDASSGGTAAVGDLGTIDNLSHGGSTGTAGTGGSSSSAPAPTQVTTAGSSLVINLDWDSSVSSAPAGFTSDMIAAAQFLESAISNAVTINLDVGYTEIGGSSLASNALGDSESYIVSVRYSQLVAALKATASTDATDASLLASLPATSPASGTYWVTTAQAKALGLSAANGSAIDGDIGFATKSDFTYGDTNTSGTVASGTYDFFATAVHEMTETMGRLLLVGDNINGGAGYSLMDLMHYSASGTRDFTQSTPGYFSVDGGNTNLGNFNTIAGGDPGDWASSVTDNSFDAYATPGVIEAVTGNDLTVMDAIGWNLTGSSTPPPGTPPSGITVAAETGSLSAIQGNGSLPGGSPLAAITEVGGIAGDSFSYKRGGAAASSFTLSASGTTDVLSAGSSGLAGGTNGKLYAITVTATDTTNGLSSAAVPLNVVVGGSGNDTVNLASMSGIVKSAPTFIYGLAGNDSIKGTGMTGTLFFDGGAGADTMTGGSGSNIYEYGSVSDSTPTAMDIITNFNVKMDMIDLTGLGSHLGTPGALSGSSIAADTIGWKTSGGNTFVYVNTSSGSESLTGANMKIELRGSVALTSANIAHV